MKIFYLPKAQLNLLDFGIQVPLTDERITKIRSFLKEKKITVVETLDHSIDLTKKDLERVHHPDYIQKLYGSKQEKAKAVSDTFELIKENGEYHRYNPNEATLPLEDLVEKFLLQTKGTMAAVREALQSGHSFYLGGGYHHAMSFGGRGFCLINDIVIAARWAQNEHQAKLIWIIDVDAHKGDGTAELTQNDPTIRTLSIHMKEGWPLDSTQMDANGKINPWFIESDIDIGIAQGEEFRYLSKLETGLTQLESLDKKLPDLAIVVQGSDPYEKDLLPSASLLKLTKEQMLMRDQLVFNFLHQRKILQAYVMSGGYGEYSYEIYNQFLSEFALTPPNTFV